MKTLHDDTFRGFASDNYAGVHPDVLAALVAANGGHQVAYGEDDYTAHLQEVMKQHFGPKAEAFCVFNGTGANVVSLQAMLPRWGAVVAATSAHINCDEGGAPEKVGNFKIHGVMTEDGKLTPELIDTQAWGFGDEHRAQPAVVSITQSTELGTLYTVDEIKAVAEHAHKLGMSVHMDGSRISNAAAALGVSLKEMTLDAGVDVLSLGGTKNGAMLAEAVVVLNPDAAPGMKFIRKSTMQLASKMRFVSAQLIALYEGDLWLQNATHANAMAQRLRDAVEAGLADGSIQGVEFTQKTYVNGNFAILPEGVADVLREKFRFYDWDEARREVRWMCSFDTSETDVDAFVAALAEATSTKK